MCEICTPRPARQRDNFTNTVEDAARAEAEFAMENNEGDRD